MLDIASKAVRSPVNVRIAERVRSLRAKRQLSLDALAKKTGVSRSMISLIERGEASATAVVLEKLAAGLGATLASLFDDPAAPPKPVSRPADRTSWRDPETGYVRRNISPAAYPSPLQIVEVVLPPGARVAYDSVARDVPVHQQVWVQAGTIELSLGGTTHRLEEDDCLATQLNAPHTFHNPTRKPARYIVVLAAEHFSSTRR